MKFRNFMLITGTVLLTTILAMAAAPSTLSLPAALDLHGPKPEAGTNGGQVFRPVGWSRDGKFAYIVEHFVDGRGGTEFKYCILNTITDALVVNISDDSETWDQRQLDDDMAESWRRTMPQYLAMLNKYKVEIGSGVAFGALPYNDRSNSLSATLNLIASSGPDVEADFERYSAYDLVAQSPGRGSKVVAKASKLRCMDAWVSGYFASPFEQRLVLVVAEEQFVFEGTEVFYRLYGCSLISGFKK